MDKFPVPRRERESYLKHRHDVNLQIILPIFLVTLLGCVFAVLAVLSTSGSNTNVSLWANVSLIWLIIPVMVFSFVILGLVIALIYALNRLLKITPQYTSKVQSYALWFTARVNIWANKIIHPVISIRSWMDLFQKRER